MTRLAVNGIDLNVEIDGAQNGPSLMLLHGFTGDVTTWEPFLDACREFKIVRVDLIGHSASDSPADTSRYSMQHAVEDLSAVLDHLNIQSTALLGYSLGGRVALHFASAHPERLTDLILESASLGIEDESERAKRVDSDSALADSIERNGIEAFVDRWQAQPLFASQSRLPRNVLDRQRKVRLSQSPRGLANSLRGMGAGTQSYLLPKLDTLSVPTLLLAGALDTRYAELARQMQSRIASAALCVIEEAGHAAHLEQSAAFSDAVTGFLRKHSLRKVLS